MSRLKKRRLNYGEIHCSLYFFRCWTARGWLANVYDPVGLFERTWAILFICFYVQKSVLYYGGGSTKNTRQFLNKKKFKIEITICQLLFFQLKKQRLEFEKI